MNGKTLKLTQGAMCTAIFGVLLLMDRQSAGFLSSILFFLYPIPQVYIASQYGFKASVPTALSMIFLSIFLGSLAFSIPAISQVISGIILGSCLYKHVKPENTLLTIIIFTAFINIQMTVVFSQVFGMDIGEEIHEMESLLNELIQKNYINVADGYFNDQFLFRLYVMSMIISGIFEGILVYTLSLLILRRLRINIERPKTLTEIFIPKWIGYISILFFFIYIYEQYRMVSLGHFDIQNINPCIQAIGLMGYFFLSFFGGVTIYILLTRRFKLKGIIGLILSFVCYYIFPILYVILGFFYISTDLHRRLLENNKE